jgi:archaellum component FlaF (FlaF/FlaG flagellin family)
MVLEVSMGTVLPVLSDVDESYDEMRNRAVDELQTDIEIDDITVQANSSFHDITINLTNRGSTVIDSSYVHCLIDGSIQGFTVNSRYFFPESSYSLSVNGLAGSGMHQVKVVTMNGISDYATYSYP